MTTVKWSEAMSVGMERLDRDHRVLIGLINRLGHAGVTGAELVEKGTAPGRGQTEGAGSADEKLMADVLATLVAYTMFHFSREEAVMEACGYPQLGEHHEEHEVLTGEVRAWEDRFRDNPEAVEPEELLQFLQGWLNHHILLQDMAYRSYVEGNPAGEAAADAHAPFDFATAAFAASEQDLEKVC